MGFSLDNQLSHSAHYKAPDPMFVATVSALAQSFPWERFERFFESRPLIDASALDQVFLMRVLALQEMLCLDDAALLAWTRNQTSLFSFFAPNYNPGLLNETALVSFRQKLNDLKLLQPFRRRCQRVILKYGHRVMDIQDVEERWVTCPLCESSALNEFSPAHLHQSDCEPWADCQECGHKFKVG